MYGGVLVCNYFQSFLALMGEMSKAGVPFNYTYTFNESLITRARNRLVDEFMKNHETTHAVFIDADIGFEARDVMAMMEMDVDIVGAPCTKKSFRWDRIQRAIRASKKELTPQQIESIAGDFVFNYEPGPATREIKISGTSRNAEYGDGFVDD